LIVGDGPPGKRSTGPQAGTVGSGGRSHTGIPPKGRDDQNYNQFSCRKSKQISGISPSQVLRRSQFPIGCSRGNISLTKESLGGNESC
jgi:hypothetical protein